MRGRNVHPPRQVLTGRTKTTDDAQLGFHPAKRRTKKLTVVVQNDMGYERAEEECELERETGFEPATLALARRCSTTELFPLPPTEETGFYRPCAKTVKPDSVNIVITATLRSRLRGTTVTIDHLQEARVAPFQTNIQPFDSDLRTSSVPLTDLRGLSRVRPMSAHSILISEVPLA